MDEDTFLITCASGHKTSVGIDDIEDIIESGTCPEKGCDSVIVEMDPDGLTIECVECGLDEQCNWQEAALYLDGECQRCRSNTETSGDFRIVGTHSHALKEYQNFCDTVDVKPQLRMSRDDYWEIVIHYTSRSNFMQIMRDHRISAKPTGYFKVPAVCMTEAPLRFSAEFKARYGPFGVAFKKGDVIRAGGGPAVYLLDSVIAAQKSYGFHDAVKPFVNVLRLPETAPANCVAKRVDFLHDREWRFPGNVLFSQLQPLGILLPEGSPTMKFRGPDEKELLRIAWQFREIRQY